MSKAFTKESDGADDDDEGAEAGPELPIGLKNYMTMACADRMKAELKELLYTTRPEVVRTVSWAAGNGDRSENGDYIYGKRRLREIDRKIRFLTKRLDSAEVIDPPAQAKVAEGRALFGATVTVEDENGAKRRYQIVGIDESDAGRGRVSWISPMGKALLGAREGDVVQLNTPKGEQELEIVKIEYVTID